MRDLLPLIGSHQGGRSALTCRYRCGDACFQEVPNTSDNEYAGDIIAGALSRRSMMRAAAVVTVAAAAGTTALAGPAAPSAEAAPLAGRTAGKPKPTASGARGLRFAAVAPNTADKVTIPDGYGQNVVIRWGEPILRGAPASTPTSSRRRRRRASSATTTTSSPCSRCAVSAAVRCWSPTTSTRTRS